MWYCSEFCGGDNYLLSVVPITFPVVLRFGIMRFRLWLGFVVTTLGSLAAVAIAVIASLGSLASLEHVISVLRLGVRYRFWLSPMGFRCWFRVGVWPIWLRELSASTANLFV